MTVEQIFKKLEEQTGLRPCQDKRELYSKMIVGPRVWKLAQKNGDARWFACLLLRSRGNFGHALGMCTKLGKASFSTICEATRKAGIRIPTKKAKK